MINIIEGSMDKIREWLVELFIRAISSCSTEQDRLQIVAWLALVRDVIQQDISTTEKIKATYRLISTKETVAIIFRSVAEAFQNYKTSALPLPLKIAIPAAMLGVAALGGQGAGLAVAGGAIGLPVILVIFVGIAGITSIIEAFVKDPGTRKYIGFVLAYIVHDEILRRQRKDLRDAMAAEVVAPLKSKLSSDETNLEQDLLSMNPLDFEKHVMAFFQDAGLIAWATKASNDFGIDGFARHEKGIIAVQCKKNSLDNPVGRPEIQKFKGAIEEHYDCIRGYVVTTSRFTKEAKESAEKNDKIRLIEMPDLIRWHRSGLKIDL